MNLEWLLRRTALWVWVLAFSVITSNGQTQEPIQLLKGHVPSMVTQGRAQRIGAMATSARLRLAIQLPLRNQEELSGLIQRLYDPHSPDYHHYLTVEEFSERYGPAAKDYQAAVEFARSHGFGVGAAPKNRLLVNITGTVAQIEETFHVKMGVYQHPWEQRGFYSADREPSLNLSVPVAHVIGLSDFSSVRKGWKHREAGTSGAGEAGDTFSGTGSGPGGSFLAGDVRAAYYGGTALTGAGQCVGLYELGGYDPADVTASFDGVSYSVPLNNVLIDGASVGVTPGSDDIEQVMDIVGAIGMAPGMSQARVYIGPPNAWGDVNVINTMAVENQCKQLSSSYSWSPPNYVQDNAIFQEFAVQGQTFLNCTLDDGSYGTSFPWTYPQDDIWVTAVGGTDLITSGPGGTWVSESAWAESGGGYSMNGSGIPDWQVPAINSSNGGSTSLRNMPDIAAEANTDNYLCYTSSGSQHCDNGWGGTSIATPRWAGFLALVNQQSVAQGLATVGYLNPTLYAIGLSSNANNVFHDITSGSNNCCGQSLYYNAVPGYDLATGWGSPNGQGTIDALAGTGTASPSFTIENSPGDLPLAAGSTYTTTVTVYSLEGFSGSVDLSVSGLPSGVAATFSPATLSLPANGSANSTVTWTISTDATMSTGEVTLAATSGSITKNASVSVTAGPPAILQVSMSTATFGSVPVGGTAWGVAVYLENRGTTMALFDANALVTDNSAFTVNYSNCSPAVMPGRTCQIYLSFTPTQAGPATGTLTITDNAVGSPQTVNLVGAGGAGTVTLSTPGLQFGDSPPGVLSLFYEMDLINNTSAKVSFPSVIATSGPFLELDDCLPSIGPGGACWITQEFRPVTLGPASGTATVFSSGTSTPLTATLSGFGGAHTVMLYPPANVISQHPPVGGVMFGYQTEGMPSVPQLVTLFNGTSNVLSISNISTSTDFTQTNDCGSTLAVNGSCIIQVVFTPSGIGAASGTLTVADNDSSSPQTISLSGTGIAVDDGSLTISPSSYDFGSLPTYSWTGYYFFYIANNGANPITIQNVSVLGPFGLYNPCSGTLAPGTGCPIQIFGYPRILGKVNGEVLVTDSAGNHFAPLSVAGTPQTASLSPASLDFGYQAPNTRSASQPVTLVNYLSNNLVITGISTSGPFAQTNNCGSSLGVYANTTCTINVTFSPTAAGVASGTLTVTDTDANGQQTVALSGTGGGPAISTTTVMSIMPSGGSLTVGSTYTLTATVTPASGTAVPSGNVIFTIGSATQTVALTAGVATYTGTAPWASGNLSIAAAYQGSAEFAASNSNTLTETITAIATTTTLMASPNPATQGSQVTLTATVTAASGAAWPTGTVSFFYNGTTLIGGASLSGNSASLVTSSLPAGTDLLTATYSGSATFASSSSSAFSLVVNPSNANPVPTIASVSPAFTSAGSSSFTLTVDGLGFVPGSTAYWGTSALTTQFVSATQLTAQIPAADIAVSGLSAITVETPAPGGGISNTFQFEVDSAGSGTAAPVFQSTSATVTPSSTANYPVTLPASATGVSVMCLNLPAGAGCSYSAAHATLQVTTSSTTPAGTYQITAVFTESLPGTASAMVVLPFVLGGLLMARRKRAGSAWLISCLAILFLAGATMVTGCGGGSGSSPTGPPNPTHQVTSSGVIYLTLQ